MNPFPLNCGNFQANVWFYSAFCFVRFCLYFRIIKSVVMSRLSSRWNHSHCLPTAAPPTQSCVGVERRHTNHSRVTHCLQQSGGDTTLITYWFLEPVGTQWFLRTWLSLSHSEQGFTMTTNWTCLNTNALWTVKYRAHVAKTPPADNQFPWITDKLAHSDGTVSVDWTSGAEQQTRHKELEIKNTSLLEAGFSVCPKELNFLVSGWENEFNNWA